MCHWQRSSTQINRLRAISMQLHVGTEMLRSSFNRAPRIVREDEHLVLKRWEYARYLSSENELLQKESGFCANACDVCALIDEQTFLNVTSL